MESAQRKLIGALITYLSEQEFISKTTYSGAMDLLHSAIDLPPLFRYPVCGEEMMP